jgi:magnesium-transporting ATPase (P-type)
MNPDSDDAADVTWGDLHVGDIIYLKRGELAPADFVILDTMDVRNAENICYVDTSSIDSNPCLTKKKALALTRSSLIEAIT